MALEKFERPATGTVTDSWSPTRNPSFAGAPRRKRYNIVADESAGNQLYAYGSALWTYFLTRGYRSLPDSEMASLENFTDMVGADFFKFTDHRGVPWKVKFADFERPSTPARGDRWDADFMLRAELKPHPSLSKIPSQFHRDLLFYAPLISNLDAFSRWGSLVFTRSTTGTRRDGAGNLGTVAINAARFDHSHLGAAWGILLEGQRTNILLRSEEIDHAIWTKTEVTVVVNDATAPDGNVTVEKLLETVVNAGHGASQAATLTNNLDYTFSAFLKPEGRTWVRLAFQDNAGAVKNAWFDVVNGVVGTVDSGVFAVIEQHTLSWWRCAITVNAASGAGPGDCFIRIVLADGSSAAYAGDTNKGIYLWGAQLEQGDSMSSYIATTAASVTRNADNLTIVRNGLHLSEQGTILFVCRPAFKSTNSSAKVAVSMGGPSAQKLAIYHASTAESFAFDDAANDQAKIAESFGLGAKIILAGRWQSGEHKIFSVSPALSHSRAQYSSAGIQDEIRFGKDQGDAQHLFGRLSEVLIFVRALTDAEVATVGAAL